MPGFEQRTRQCRHDVRFAGAGPADQAHVGGARQELAAQQLSDLPAQRRCVAVQVEGCQRFVFRQLRIVQQPCHASIGAVVGFLGDQLGKISNVAPAFSGCTFGKLEIMFEERGEPQRFQAQLQRVIASDRWRRSYAHRRGVRAEQPIVDGQIRWRDAPDTASPPEFAHRGPPPGLLHRLE